TAQQVASLNAYHHCDGGEEVALAAESDDIVRKVISSLKPRQQQIIKLRYGIGHARHSLQQVADLLGVTHEAVRQMQKSTEEKLVKRLQQQGFEPGPAQRAVRAEKQNEAHEATRSGKSSLQEV